ncbi:ABC transporter substrate-binding protein [Tepidibacillus marianensis]|uniref:ABC transporter substrate-binding protein n=1 Tax=Tepidibacillus marianensis TaxID=3131995 RepID=UPI0030D259D5
MKGKIFLFLSVVLSFLLVVGCSSDATTTSTAPDKEKIFTYAMSGAYTPFNFKKDGQLEGFDVEIGKALAEKMGMKSNPIATPWETIIEGLKRGKYDAIIGSMAITEDRKKQVDFSKPYYRSGAQIFVKDDNQDIKKAEDLNGKRIGVVKSSTFGDLARKYSKNIKEYSSDILALQDLPTGRIDAVITDQLVGLNAIQENVLKLKDVADPLYLDEMAIPVKKGNKELLEKINKALDEIINDGTYEKISNKWFGRNILN